MERSEGTAPAMGEVKTAFARRFAEVFGFHIIEKH
jgi:hypothetical protein